MQKSVENLYEFHAWQLIFSELNKTRISLRDNVDESRDGDEECVCWNFASVFTLRP